MLVFDCETKPLDDTDYILSLADPFEPKPHPGEFDESKVAYGNTKDAAKRAAKLEDSRAKHTTLVENYEAEVEQARAEWRANILDRAALSAATAQILVIGVGDAIAGKFGSTEQIIDQGGSEADQLAWFWQKYEKCRDVKANGGKPRKMIGHNILGFDLPFLIRRSLILQVDVPRTVYEWRGKWLNFDELFVDTCERWRLGQNGSQCEAKLHQVGMAFGLGGKLADPRDGQDGKLLNGGDFWKLWRDDRELARKYLHRDLELTAKIAVRLGVC